MSQRSVHRFRLLLPPQNHLSIILEKRAFLWYLQLGAGKGLLLISTIHTINATALGLEGVVE